jgi:uncharacterized C2H2 Zn-finger protein
MKLEPEDEEIIELTEIELLKDEDLSKKNSSTRLSKRSREKKETREFRKPSNTDFRCYICDQTFELIKTKNEHVINDHSEVDRCGHCDHLFKTPSAVERHIKSHFIKDDNFLCPVCGAFFYKKYTLERHIVQLHGDTSPLYYCDLCENWKSKFRTNLKRHMRTVHLNIKQHRCPYTETCPDKFFTTKDTLNFHLVGHHNLVLIKCQSCSQKFDSEQDLQEHQNSGRCIQRTIRRRNREPKCSISDQTITFSCQICDRTFQSKSQFSVHFHQKHKTSLTCKVCSKEFTQYANLLRHIKVSLLSN